MSGANDNEKGAGRQAGAGKGDAGQGVSGKAVSGKAMGRACPICGKPTVEAYRPFCSKRCADVDLNRWLTGAYAIPVVADDDEDGDQPEPRS